MSLRLHPKHGVNPTMPLCFFCSKPTGEIALLGAAYKEEAPRHMVLNYEPCEVCKAQMAKGITFIEAYHTIPPKPTGRFVVVKEEVIPKMIGNEDMQLEVLKKRVAYITPEAWEKVGLNNVGQRAE